MTQMIYALYNKYGQFRGNCTSMERVEYFLHRDSETRDVFKIVDFEVVPGKVHGFFNNLLLY